MLQRIQMLSEHYLGRHDLRQKGYSDLLATAVADPLLMIHSNIRDYFDVGLA